MTARAPRFPCPIWCDGQHIKSGGTVTHQYHSPRIDRPDRHLDDLDRRLVDATGGAYQPPAAQVSVYRIDTRHGIGEVSIYLQVLGRSLRLTGAEAETLAWSLSFAGLPPAAATSAPERHVTAVSA